MKNKVFLCLGIVCLLLLTGCNDKKSLETRHDIITVEQGKDVVIDKLKITSTATYYNYKYDNYVIQIFVVKASDDTIRVLFNTCNACNPAKDSYFIQKGDYFECQTCGNKFHIDDIGLKNDRGCSPISILDENKTITNDKIIIASNFIEEYKDKFKDINIYKN